MSHGHGPTFGAYAAAADPPTLHRLRVRHLRQRGAMRAAVAELMASEVFGEPRE